MRTPDKRAIENIVFKCEKTHTYPKTPFFFGFSNCPANQATIRAIAEPDNLNFPLIWTFKDKSPT
jgi:hypothetical protein